MSTAIFTHVENRQGCSKVRAIAARAAPAALKSEGRKPKSEGSPKAEIREGLQPLTGPAASEAILSGLRISDFFRISVFGLRIWAGSREELTQRRRDSLRNAEKGEGRRSSPLRSSAPSASLR